MSRKFSDFFKIEAKTTDIKENISSLPKIRECRVILKDIKHKFGRNQPKLFNEVSRNGQNNSDDKQNICSFCDKKLSTATHKNEHMKKFHPTEFELFSCKICNRKFFQKAYFGNSCEKEASEWTS